MILKELDPFLGGSQDEIAHRIAQDRMAYHLRRFFGKSEEVDVLNYLRVSSGTRRHDGRPSAAASVRADRDRAREPDRADPDQGRRPVVALARGRAGRDALADHPGLSARVVAQGVPGQDRQAKRFLRSRSNSISWLPCPIPTRIQWPTMGSLPEVCNADQVHERVNQRILQCRRNAQAPGVLTAPERRRLGEFLRSLHQPMVRAAPR